jgi:chromosome segregation ATPase
MSQTSKGVVMSDQPELTMRDTKATILAEYEHALETIETLKSQQFSPGEIKAREADEIALMATDEMDWSLGNVFVAIREKIDSNLREMQSNLEKEKEDLNQVRRAKAALQRELKDLYGISAQAHSFAALVESQQKRTAEFEEKMAEQQQRIQTEYDEHRKAAILADAAAKDDRQRQEEEWTYKFQRECQAKTDHVNDDLASKLKEHNALIEAEYKKLGERTEAVKKQETEIQELRERVARIPEEIEAALDESRKKMATTHAIEVNALKRNHTADSKILEHEVAALKETNKSLSEMVGTLEDKLERAYDKIQSVATQALEASGNARTTAEVQKAVANTPTSGKR